MATVPEINSDMMDFYRDNDDSQFYEADGLNQKKDYSSLKVQYPDSCPRDGLLEKDDIQLKYTAQPNRFQRAVVVVVAIEKMKHKAGHWSTLFQDNDLMTIFSSIFQEEPITFETYDCDLFESDAIFRFSSSWDCTIQDIDQKCLTLSNASQLRALHLNGHNINQQVIFSMNYFTGEVGSQKTHVVLCIKKNNLYLSCVMHDGKPTLQLEEIANFPRTNVEKRFIFNKTEINDKYEFESAEYPNWYISTSQMENQPVFLQNMRGGQDITNFILDLSP